MVHSKNDGLSNNQHNRKTSLRSHQSHVSKGKKVGKYQTLSLGNEKGICSRAASTNQHFISSEARCRYQTFSGGPFIFERAVKFEDLEDTGLMEVLRVRKWVKLASTPANSCENMVHEFYANFLPEPFMEGKGTPVRGTNVVITPTLINKYFKVPQIAESDEYNVEHIAKAKMVKELYGSKTIESKQILYQKFTVGYAFWCTFASHNLFPSKHFTKIREPRARLVHAIGTNRPINVGKCIFTAIYDADTTTRYGFPFPALITQFCLNAGVPMEVDDLWVSPPKPIDGVTYDTLHDRIMNGNKPNAERKAKKIHKDSCPSTCSNEAQPPVWVYDIFAAVNAIHERQEQAIANLKAQQEKLFASMCSQLTSHGQSLTHVTQLLHEAKTPATKETTV